MPLFQKCLETHLKASRRFNFAGSSTRIALRECGTVGRPAQPTDWSGRSPHAGVGAGHSGSFPLLAASLFGRTFRHRTDALHDRFATFAPGPRHRVSAAGRRDVDLAAAFARLVGVGTVAPVHRLLCAGSPASAGQHDRQDDASHGLILKSGHVAGESTVVVSGTNSSNNGDGNATKQIASRSSPSAETCARACAARLRSRRLDKTVPRRRPLHPPPRQERQWCG